MNALILVGVGGAVGSISRYLLATWAQSYAQPATFPLGTLVVNVIGSFIIGVIGAASSLRGAISPDIRLLVVTGILGGFTTFSAFSFETFALFRDGSTTLALSNVMLQVVLGVMAAFLGFKLLAIMS